MPCNDLHKGPYAIRRADNLVIRVKVLGFLQALHNEPEPDVSFYMYRVLDYCIYGTLRTQRWGFDVGLFVRVVSYSKQGSSGGPTNVQHIGPNSTLYVRCVSANRKG